jgi:azurin
MKLRMWILMIVVALCTSLMIAACGGGGSAPASSSSSGTGPTTLELGSDGEGLAFKPNALSVSVGQKITIKFKDNSAAQQHNWVLVKGGADVAQKVATGGLVTGADKNYLPSDVASIIANTTLSSAGQTVETTFTAPAAGTYTFLCTVPGHFPLMQGTLTVN